MTKPDNELKPTQQLRRSKPKKLTHDTHTHVYQNKYREGEYCIVCDSPRAVCDMPFCPETVYCDNLCKNHWREVQEIALAAKEKYRALLPKMRDDIPALTAESFKKMAGVNEEEWHIFTIFGIV